MSLRRTLENMSPNAVVAAVEDYVDTDDKKVYSDFFESVKRFSTEEITEEGFRKELFSFFSDLACEKDKLGTLLTQLSDQELRGLAARMFGTLKEGGLPDDEVLTFLDSADTALVNCIFAIKDEIFTRFMLGGSLK